MNSFEKIYEAVSQIPKGKVATYKQIAKIAGVKNARVVGFALNKNKNPDRVPCHRVVNIRGELTGYAFGGIKMKKELLEKEGIKFDGDKINLNLFSL